MCLLGAAGLPGLRLDWVHARVGTAIGLELGLGSGALGSFR